jgi:integrase/recombinase XerD
MKLSEPAKEVVNLIRRHRLTYDALRQATHAARKHLGIKPPVRGRKLPKLLSESSLRAYFKAVDTTDNLQHQIMLRILLYTGVRVAELCAIRVADVDLQAGKVFIESGKGDKDRYVLFPDTFRLPLKAYVQSHPENEYLFESQQRRPYSTRRIQQIMEEYAKAAGIEEQVHPHLLRHQLLTFLTSQGMTDAAIQLVSGHASKKSLERYQHMSLKDAQQPYQDAMRKLGVD